MKQVERPSPVLVATLNHDFYRFADTMIGIDSCILQMIESPQNVIVPKRGKGETQPAFVDDFAGSKRSEHAAFEQIAFAPLAGVRDGPRFASSAGLFEQSFEHADGRMERRASA
jgi:hypothetical protein